MRKAGKLFSIIPHFHSWPKKGEMPGSVCFRRQFLHSCRHRLKLRSKLPVSNPPFNRFPFSFLVAFSAGIFHLSPYSKKPFSKALPESATTTCPPKRIYRNCPIIYGKPGKKSFPGTGYMEFPVTSSLAEEGSHLLPAAFVYLPQACHRPSASCSLEYGFPFISTAQNEGQ